jgi:EamA domain-containing membrane protein RarD
MAPDPQKTANGLRFALAAYTIWGFLPLYIALMRHVPAFELVAWRIVFTLPFCLAIAALRPVQLASFVLIWMAIALFSWDLLRRHPALAKPAPA